MELFPLLLSTTVDAAQTYMPRLQHAMSPVHMQASKLDIPYDPSSGDSLSDYVSGLCAWLDAVLDGNRFLVAQWQVFPPGWQVCGGAVDPAFTMPSSSSLQSCNAH